RCTCLNLEESKNYTWSSKGQKLEATGIMWCAYHNLYNNVANFVSGKEGLIRFLTFSVSAGAPISAGDPNPAITSISTGFSVFAASSIPAAKPIAAGIPIPAGDFVPAGHISFLLACSILFVLVNDITRLQALVDKKKVVVTKSAIRECMSAKRTLWNEFSSSMASTVICLSTEIEEEGDADEHVDEVTAGDDAHGDASATHGEVLTVTQEPSIPSLTPPNLPPQPPKDLPSTSQRVDTFDDTVMDDATNQGRMITKMDKDDVVILMDDKEDDKKVEEAKVDKTAQEDETEPTEVQEVVDVVTTAKLITEVVTAASETVTAASAITPTVEPQVPAATPIAAPARVADAPSKRRKGVLKAKEDPAVKRYQAMKRKPQIKAQARKNMMMYLKNVTKEQMEEEENRALQTINETPAKKATKRRKLNEEVEDLKRHLHIVPNEDDDVYTEATPLARKVPVVDYEIIELNNKPYYKIIKADGTHQLYISFLTLLKNFDIDDLEALWSLVKERFSTAKPKNFSDDFLLTILGAMFEKPDAHAQI
nr:hypothetical protein [Tanacetum cinerariifolium]